MLKYKSIIFLLVCNFTISSPLWADIAPSDGGISITDGMDVGFDGQNGVTDMGREKSTPLDPDYQPEVTSSPECTCRSVQTKSNLGWLPIIFIGAVLGFSRKKWRKTTHNEEH